MTTVPETTSVHQEITVAVPPVHAFRVFTEQFDRIKPRDYNLLGVDIAESVFEPWVGGHLYDRGIDGSECRWARVLAYEPPDRFVISWDITPQWQLETDPDRTSEVEVTFTSMGETQTRVAVEHRHLERHGEGWQHTRTGLAGGWTAFLANFAALVPPA